MDGPGKNAKRRVTYRTLDGKPLDADAAKKITDAVLLAESRKNPAGRKDKPDVKLVVVVKKGGNG